VTRKRLAFGACGYLLVGIGLYWIDCALVIAGVALTVHAFIQ